MKYKLTLTEEQYNHIAWCVEVCHRIMCGDTMELRQLLPLPIDKNLIEEIKAQAFPELMPNQFYGWNGGYCNKEVSEDFRNAFDKEQAQGYQIYRQMRYKQNIAKGIGGVLSSPTLTTSKAEQSIIEIFKD